MGRVRFDVYNSRKNTKLNMTKEQQIQQALQQWWKSETEVTTLDFKNYLRKQFPGEVWTQQYVSKFLYQQGFEFFTRMNSNGDVYRVYSAPMILTADVHYQPIVLELVQLQYPFQLKDNRELHKFHQSLLQLSLSKIFKFLAKIKCEICLKHLI